MKVVFSAMSKIPERKVIHRTSNCIELEENEDYLAKKARKEKVITDEIINIKIVPRQQRLEGPLLRTLLASWQFRERGGSL
jgi:hypothetical protein